jgi:ribosome-binding protein aMBF1 (putative translation factor)
MVAALFARLMVEKTPGLLNTLSVALKNQSIKIRDAMADEDIYKKLGALVRKRRRALDMTQAELGKHLGISAVSFICYIEKGIRRPHLLTLYRMEKLLGPLWAEATEEVK